MLRTGGDGPTASRASSVEKDTPGLSFGKQEKKLGWNSQPTAAVIFDDCRVPVANRIGAEGDGFKIAMPGSTAAASTSAPARSARRAPASSWRASTCKTRKQFGKTLAEFQALQFRFADMATELEAARVMLHRAAGCSTTARRRTTPGGMAKRLATDNGFEAVNQALQLHGGYGYLKDYPGRALSARFAGAPDPRRHQRDHAGDHRPRFPPSAVAQPARCLTLGRHPRTAR